MAETIAERPQTKRYTLSQITARPVIIPTCTGGVELTAQEHDGQIVLRINAPTAQPVLRPPAAILPRKS